MSFKPVENVLFLDTATVPQYETFTEAPKELQDLFVQRYKNELEELIEGVKSKKTNEDFLETLWNEKASLQAEFGKIVCISVGMMYNGKFVKKSFLAEDETTLLNDFVSGKLADKLNDVSGGTVFCNYSGESFDYPFLAKRLIMNGVMVPKFLFYPERKPWERHFLIDLKNIWRWDMFNSAVTINLLAYSLGLGSGDNIDGFMIKDIYYVDKDIKKISEHCENDIELLYKCYNKLYANFANA